MLIGGEEGVMFRHRGRGIPVGAKPLVLAVLLIGVSAPGAPASTYVVSQCDPATGVGAPDAIPFDTSARDNYSEENHCAQGDGVYLGSGHKGAPSAFGESAGWAFAAPDATAFTRIDVVANGREARGHFPEIVMGSEFHNSFGALLDSSQSFSWTEGSGGSGNLFTLRLRCVQNDGPPENPDADCQDDPGPTGAYVAAGSFRFTLRDSAPPTISDAASALATDSAQRGVLSATVSGSDRGAGLSRARAFVNGELAGEAPYQCQTAGTLAARLVPCQLQGSVGLPLDSSELPFHQGLNRTRFCVIEFGAEAAEACADGPDVRVDNACPITGAEGIIGFERMRFVGGGSGDGRTTYGSDVRLVGRAVTGEDEPVSDSEVCIGERIALGSYTDERIIGTPETNRDGVFSLRVPSGPSRAFRVAQWQRSGGVVEQFLSLDVKAKPRLAIVPGRVVEGRKMKLRAKLNEPVVTGQPVRIEARARAGWIGLPECTGSADAEGRLACKYRLPKQPGSGDYTLRFRVVAPRADGSPYLFGVSKIVRKRVQG